jgi:hypothetical protein
LEGKNNRSALYVFDTNFASRINKMRTTSSLRLLFLAMMMMMSLHHLSAQTTTASSQKKKSSSSSSSSFKAKRINHLDYFDADTMLYYLQAPKLEYDVAILFYAQWCKNCHAFAPLWDQISRYLHAGTQQSQLIMGLFDCEANYQHAEICTEQIGITHYPTIVYMSMAGNKLQKKQHRTIQIDKNNHQKKIIRNLPTHMTTFPGNWQYADAVMDWLTALSKLSNWHRHDYGSRIRQWVLFLGQGGSKRRHNNHNQQQQQQQSSSLPIGIPTDIQTQQELVQLQQLQTETKQLAVRSSIFVDCLLLPKSAPLEYYLISTTAAHNQQELVDSITMSDDRGATNNYTDLYALLKHRNAWNTTTTSTTTTTDLVLRTCASEVSLDYCTRLSEQYADTWLEERLGSTSSSLDITEAEYVQFSDHLHQYLNETEPFCAVMDECVMVNFENVEKCQPSRCPFRDPIACRYLTACLTESIQIEYAKAMQLLLDTTPRTTTGGRGTTGTSTSTTKSDHSNTKNRKSKVADEETTGAAGEGGGGGGKKKRSAWGF